jgi:multiple sugar transport system ATP-binding protein
MAKIELTGISKTFGPASFFSSRGFPLSRANEKPRGAPFAIQNLNLTIPHGKTMVILGPSGCGKSTLLRIIAGLIKPDAGEVKYDGVDMADVPPGTRRIGMIFQNYALYPHLSSKINILSYFYFRKKTPQLDAEARAKYQRTSEMMGVDIRYLEDRRPDTLSGGEKQRVALGRCITRDPALFLLDEPFSNLDQTLREKYRVNLKVLLTQFKITTVYVTHDQHEALILSDALAIMQGGKIEQLGSYEGIYSRPKNLFVAQFLNPDPSTPAINLIDGRYLLPSAPDMIVGVRPEEIELSTEAREGGLAARIASRMHLPTKLGTIVNVRVGDYEAVVRMPGEQVPALGTEVWLTLKQYHLFAKDTGLRVKSSPL